MNNSSSNMPGPAVRILLVDDHKLGLTARTRILEDLGYSIVAAAAPEQALAHFASEKFDLIITDYMMPNMNGVDFIQKVRQSNDSVPIILISGYADALGLSESNTGANSVIAKNANEIQHLVRAVARLLKRGVPKKPAASHRPAARARRQSV